MHNDGCNNGGRLIEMSYYTNEYEASEVFWKHSFSPFQ